MRTVRWLSLLALATTLLVGCNAAMEGDTNSAALSLQAQDVAIDSVDGVHVLPPIGNDAIALSEEGLDLEIHIYALTEGEIAELLSPTFSTTDGTIRFEADDDRSYYMTVWDTSDTRLEPGDTARVQIQTPSGNVLASFDVTAVATPRERRSHPDRGTALLIQPGQAVPIKVIVEPGAIVADFTYPNQVIAPFLPYRSFLLNGTATGPGLPSAGQEDNLYLVNNIALGTESPFTLVDAGDIDNSGRFTLSVGENYLGSAAEWGIDVEEAGCTVLEFTEDVRLSLISGIPIGEPNSGRLLYLAAAGLFEGTAVVPFIDAFLYTEQAFTLQALCEAPNGEQSFIHWSTPGAGWHLVRGYASDAGFGGGGWPVNQADTLETNREPNMASWYATDASTTP